MIRFKRSSIFKWTTRILGASCVSLMLSACGGGGSQTAGLPGVIDGTGDRVKGITAIGKPLANINVELRTKDGKTAQAISNAKGEFEFGNVKGTGPYLLRVQNNGTYLYSIAHDPDSSSSNVIEVNIHQYTDLIIRNWFKSKGLDVDAVFTGQSTTLPTNLETNNIRQSVEGVLSKLFPELNVPANFDVMNTRFEANSTAFDKVLDVTQISYADNQVTLTWTDPSNNTQVVVINNYNLGSLFDTQSNKAPTAPTDIRAFFNTTSTLFVWKPATDDKGVAGYEVYVDGQSVGTTPYPYFEYSQAVSTGQKVSVKAIDSDGLSTTSTEQMLSNSGSTDNTPPPTPTAVMLVQQGKSIKVSWSQSGVADVKGFNVKRTLGANGAEQVNQKATATEYLDAHNLQSGTQYCYKVNAFDGAGNQSTSAQKCITYTTTDVSSCATPIVINQNITTDTVLDGCYNVNTDLKVRSNLTIKAGSTLRFARGKGLSVESSGSLNAQGQAGRIITFTAQDKTPGYWDGINIHGSVSSKNKLDYTVVEYAGNPSSFEEANVYVWKDSKLSITNSIIKHSELRGIRLANGAIISQFANNTITSNGTYPVSMYANDSDILDGQSNYSGNKIDKLSLAGSFSSDVSFPKFNVPIYLNSSSIGVNGKLTIGAGNVLEFVKNGQLNLPSSGQIVAAGNANEKITFQGKENQDGYWTGIQLTNGSSANNELTHVVVKNAGSGDGNGLGAVSLFGSGNRLKLHHSRITGSRVYGLDVNNRSVLDMSNVVLDQNANGPVRIASDVVHMLDKSSQYTNNNGKDYIAVVNKNLNFTSPVLKKLNVDYHFISTNGVYKINSGTHFTIEPGVTIKMAEGARIDVNSGSSLEAKGTPTNPITITGQESIKGYWAGIQFKSSSVKNALDHVHLSYGGKESGNAAGLVGLFGQDVTVDITNSKFEHSKTYGINNYDATGGKRSGNTFDQIEKCDTTVSNNSCQ